MTSNPWIDGAATALGACMHVAVSHPFFALIVAGALYVAKTS